MRSVPALAPLASILALALLACSCGEGTWADAGRDAHLLVRGATFFRGDVPTESGGPSVASVDLALTTLRAGVVDSPLRGALAPGSTAAAISMGGDAGYWIVPAGLPGVDAPDFPTFDAPVSIAASTPPGPYELLVRAVDGEGHYGPASKTSFQVVRVDVSGTLVVSLTWDTEADLDLHVVDPAGTEIWTHAPSSWKAPPPGAPVPPDAWKDGGNLDFDSNAQCVIDGRRQEDVVWARTAPRGAYVVRVDTPSLCGEVAARWNVVVSLEGRVIARAAGTSLASDTRGLHEAGSGVLALQFVAP
jgi:hypothetical protein